MINVDNIKNETTEIYKILNTKKCFQQTDFNSRYLPQLERNMIQFKNISTKLFIAQTKSKEYLEWHKRNIPQFQFNENDFHLEIITLFCHHALSTFELLKRFLLNTLDLNKINQNYNVNLTKISMLGDIIDAIKKIASIKPNVIDELMDKEFRNTLAHDSWYMEDGLFKFMNTKGINRQLSLTKVYSNVIKIWFVNKTFSTRYNEDYYPECIEMYDNGLGKIMDEVIPLYPNEL